MRLSDLLPDRVVAGDARDHDVTGVTEDSRRVQPGHVFVAVRGTALDGHTFIDEAIARGAVAVVVESDIGRPLDDVLVVRVESSGGALADLAAQFHGHPARHLRLIGFTGTFGKTTTSDVLRALLHAGGRRPGVLGSLGAGYGTTHIDTGGLTTPSPPVLHRTLAALRDAGADTVIMEVTTHALLLDRVAGLRFAGGLLAAVMPGEHTDFHRSYDEYVAAKRRFIDYLAPEAVLAYDADNRAARTIAVLAAVRLRAGLSVHGRPEAAPHDVTAHDILLDDRGAEFTLQWSAPVARAAWRPAAVEADGVRLRSALLGRANVHNVGLALAFALVEDVDLDRARDALASLRPLRRRMERLEIVGRTVLDDTAAHPDSFLNAFEVADLLPHDRLLVAYVLRGNRGADINRRNALALADLAALSDADAVFVSGAADVVRPVDRPQDEEIDATRRTFASKGRPVAWRETLESAMADVARASRPGDVIVLLGAQGMNEGARLLRERL